MSKITIRKRLFRGIMVLSFAILIVTSFLLSLVLYHSGMSNINQTFKEKNIAIKYYVDGYFSKICNTVEFLSQMKEVQNIPYLGEKEHKKVLRLYKNLEKADADINYIYSGYENGSLLINDYIPPANYNPKVRPWYKAALKARPNITRGVPYQEIKTKKWLVSISKVLIDSKNRISGVIAIDSSADKIVNMLKNKNALYKSSHSLIVALDGKVVVAQKRILLHKKISKILNTHINFTQQSGKVFLNLNGDERYVYYTRLDELGWVILTIVDRCEIIRPIVSQIAVIILVISLMIFIFGWILSNYLGRQVVLPLIELKKRVHTIVKDNLDNDGENIYSKDEIGTIASDIEQLARSELYSKNIALKNANEKLKLLSITDSLTQLFNRRKMNIEIEKEHKRSLRYKSRFSLIMFDIDWFKKINDTYGHQAGDVVLKELSNLTKEIVRSTDIVSRWGGEEFLILCTETNLDTAYNLSQRLRKATEDYRFSVEKKVTISIGVHEFDGKENVDELLKNVDDKLYKAKHSGRNCVIA
ncbi:MAG: diguanylate cyclase [Sulfurospirillum sp.]